MITRIKPKWLTANKGFTLLEIMVAISIIAIVLTAVYKLQSQTIVINHVLKFQSTAPLLAQMKLAEFETKSFEDQTDDSGDFGNEFPGYRWAISFKDVDSEALGTTANDLKKINLTISYNKDERTYTIQTYRFIP